MNGRRYKIAYTERAGDRERVAVSQATIARLTFSWNELLQLRLACQVLPCREIYLIFVAECIIYLFVYGQFRRIEKFHQ